MNSEKWQKTEDIFHAALELEVSERNSFLQKACAGDEELLGEVQKLISAHEKSEGFIENPVFSEAIELISERTETSDLIGKKFGVYQIIEEIGQGGMGAVYLAERTDQEFEKKVAIKIIKRGMDTEAVLRRFRNERQILASLEHPNIARLLDGGTTKDGLPYFVMEYIEGLPITEFADTHQLSINERLELFRQVCAAIGFAHQRLVVHRDIKPSNILVTNDGIPKLLDFGIAKLMDPDRIGKETVPTAPGLRLMTPEYASPEQILGKQVTTLSDVYSLGVILYELLSGHSPYKLKENTPFEIANFINTKEPLKPSERAVGTRKHEDAETQGEDGKKEINPKSKIQNPKSLQGDLDNIVLKAMRKEPDERYASVGQFSEDIRRHLVGLPVIARPLNFRERFVKFSQRNKIAVGLTAIIFLTLLGGIVATTWQSVRANRQKELAEKRFNEIRKFVRTVLFDYHDAIQDLPGSTPVRERLVRDSLEYLDGLAAEASNDSTLQLELATAYERVGDVQGGTMKSNLGDTAGSIKSYKKALAILQSIVASDSQNKEARHKIASCSRRLATLLLETGDTKGSLEESRKSQTLFQELIAENPTDLDLRFELGATLNRIGLILLEQGDFSGALESYQKDFEIYQSLPEAEQKSEKTGRAISIAYEHLATVLLSMGETEKALDNNRRGLEIRQVLSNDFPQNANHLRALAVSYYWQGRILSKMERNREALESYQKNLQIAEKLHSTDPNNEVYRSDTAYGLISSGDMQFILGNTTEAIASYRKAQILRAEDAKADPANLWKQTSLIASHAKICQSLVKTGQAETAQNDCSTTLSLMDKTKLEPTNAQDRSLFASTYSDIGEAYSTFALRQKENHNDQQKYRKMACDLYKKSLEIWQDLKNRGIMSNSDTENYDSVVREVTACQSSVNQ